MSIPVISVTDLYHPHQDVGDNLDLVTAYGLPEIDLRGVVLDCTETFRQPVAGPFSTTALWPDDQGPRDAGIIPVSQLNYIFDRNVPHGMGPFCQMQSPDDPMADAPRFQQTGIELILDELSKANEPLHILSFGSARAIAAAYNRAPKLFADGRAIIELCAGSPSGEFLEWNVALDPNAIVCLLRAPISINIYPDAAETTPFGLSAGNTFYRLPNLLFVNQMEPRLRRYMKFALGRVCRSDFLRALDYDWDCDEADRRLANPHNVWETQLWMRASRRVLARAPGGYWRILPLSDVSEEHEVFGDRMVACEVQVADDGCYRLTHVAPDQAARATKWCYERDDPLAQQAAFAEAVPALYLSYAR